MTNYKIYNASYEKGILICLLFVTVGISFAGTGNAPDDKTLILPLENKQSNGYNVRNVPYNYIKETKTESPFKKFKKIDVQYFSTKRRYFITGFNIYISLNETIIHWS